MGIKTVDDGLKVITLTGRGTLGSLELFCHDAHVVCDKWDPMRTRVGEFSLYEPDSLQGLKDLLRGVRRS
jgi:hypothetical protein